MRYTWEREDWPEYRFDSSRLDGLLEAVTQGIAELNRRVLDLGVRGRNQAVAESLEAETLASSEIEGERLDRNSVASSIARRLGLPMIQATADARSTGAAEVALDASDWKQPLTRERLKRWHRLLFPTQRPLARAIIVGGWRDDRNGPMQIVSGGIGHERVHYEAPPADRIDREMDRFLEAFETTDVHPLIHAGIAHLWFETIHPFEDGNGRVGRAVMDLALARFDRQEWRYYSASAQIMLERSEYYRQLERASKGDLEVTTWLEWFLGCLNRAVKASDARVDRVLRRARFWEIHADKALNERQRRALAKILELPPKPIGNKDWQKLAKAIPRTAARDLADLVEMGVLAVEGSGRGTRYQLIVD